MLNSPVVRAELGKAFFDLAFVDHLQAGSSRRATPGLLAIPRPAPQVGAATRAPPSLVGYKC